MAKNFKTRIVIVELYKSGESPRDIAKLLNVSRMLVRQTLNLSLQGKNTNVFSLKSKIEAFIKKLNTWKQKVENDSFEMFSLTKKFLANNDVESNAIKPVVIDHLSNLLKQIHKYFLPELDSIEFGWIQSSFAMQQQSTEHFSLKFQEELADLSSDSKLGLELSGKNTSHFLAWR